MRRRVRASVAWADAPSPGPGNLTVGAGTRGPRRVPMHGFAAGTTRCPAHFGDVEPRAPCASRCRRVRSAPDAPGNPKGRVWIGRPWPEPPAGRSVPLRRRPSEKRFGFHSATDTVTSISSRLAQQICQRRPQGREAHSGSPPAGSVWRWMSVAEIRPCSDPVRSSR